MTEIALFLRGMVIGFAIAVPVGPVGLLCIRRALGDGRRAAFVAGLGAAVAATFYGAVAGFGLTYVSDFLLAQQIPLSLVGGLFLLLMGWRSLRLHAVLAPPPRRGPGMAKDFLSTLAITLTNPGTIFAFLGVFAAMGAGGVVAAGSGWLVLGVFIGSAAWWLLLSAAAGAVRSSFTPLWLKRLNQGSGVALLLFGTAVLANALL